jgi:DNA-binding PadR family transcriptional regulator
MSPTTRSTEQQLLLGEWACLGILATGPTHGFDIARRLRPTGDVGRVWSLSRPLTYRSLDQLATRGLIVNVGEAPGIAGGTKTILALTPSGGEHLAGWLADPVPHLRDLRSALLLKLVIGQLTGNDMKPLVDAQHRRVSVLAAAYAAELEQGAPAADVVAMWRFEATQAAIRFLERLPR